MIRLATDCAECIHEKVCKNKNNAVHDMKMLSTAIYGEGPNDDYNWATMMECHNVDITFSCPDYHKKGGNLR